MATKAELIETIKKLPKNKVEEMLGEYLEEHYLSQLHNKRLKEGHFVPFEKIEKKFSKK
ncbi:MAG: hypothetical protein M1169_04845 [Firmicutes bacterium]|nr:hypothetical protein [Bacillota bacterium]